MPHQQLIKNISEVRFKPYLEIAENNMMKAIKLYEFNIKISESFYPALHNLEISLRNKFYSQLSKTHGPRWLLNNKLLSGTNGREIVNINKINDICLKQKDFDANVIISNLSLGFWTSLLYPNYELAFWRGCLRDIFPTNQKVIRSDIHKKLENIKSLRNRLAHHELILKNGIETCHSQIYEIMEYLAPETAKWTKTALDRFPDVLEGYKVFLTKK